MVFIIIFYHLTPVDIDDVEIRNQDLEFLSMVLEYDDRNHEIRAKLILLF